jgi:hypothetical protein
MKTETLEAVAKKLVAPGKGILAADESSGTIEKRLKTINVSSTEENRRMYREILFTTNGAGADVMKRIATPMVGGIVTSTIMELLVFPAIYFIWRSRALKDSAPDQVSAAALPAFQKVT